MDFLLILILTAFLNSCESDSKMIKPKSSKVKAELKLEKSKDSEAKKAKKIIPEFKVVGNCDL